MEQILVVVFEDEKRAYQGRSALRQLEVEGSIALRAGAVVAKAADGTTTVRQYDDVEPIGTLVGTSVGTLVGLLGGPVGVAIGAASGLTVGALSDLGSAGVVSDFVEEVSRALTPSRVAVIAEVEEGWTTPVDSRMEALGGIVIRRPLSEVREQLRNEEVAAMKADLAELKQEIATANAERRAKLQEKVNRLEQKIEAQQKRTEEWLEEFKKRQQENRELLKKNASNVAQAVKELAKTPLL
jgi:uncharacterized membrane protein